MFEFKFKIGGSATILHLVSVVVYKVVVALRLVYIISQ